MTDPAAAIPRIGTFEPLRSPTFAILWSASVLGNVATFMRDATNTWMVTELSRDPAQLGLVQAMAMLPVFLFSLPAGVLADIFDRRRLVLVAQAMSTGVAVALWLLASLQWLSLASLAGLAFLGGTGAALMLPTWQAVTPDLVPAAQQRSAVTLGSLGINVARATGPALGGLLLGLFGAAAVYALGAAACAAVFAALLWWRPAAAARDGLTEAMPGAFRAGLRFARANRQLQSVLLRALVVFGLSSCLWALLPLVSRELLQAGAGFYGVLLGAVGAGAIVAAILLPRLRQRWQADDLMLASALVSAGVLAALATGPHPLLAVVLLALFGAAWITALTTLGGLAQGVLPGWVRARGLALHLTVSSGAMALGNLGWGLVAKATGLPITLALGAASLAACGLAFRARRLPGGDADLQPSSHWPEPSFAADVAGDRGPVLVQIRYRIPVGDRPAFLALLQRFSQARRRDGAYQWGLVEDASDPQALLEWFFVESWAEHLRQHRRLSMADADLQREAVAFHVGPGPPQVAHWLAVASRQTVHPPGVAPE